MVQFIIGLVIGSTIGFIICALFSVVSSKNRDLHGDESEKTGDNDARK